MRTPYSTEAVIERPIEEVFGRRARRPLRLSGLP